MNRYGFTAGELRALGPSTVMIKSKQEHVDHFFRNVGILSLIFAASLFLHFYVEPRMAGIGEFLGTFFSPEVAHADIEDQSDTAQEIAYCKAWNTNATHITGADNMRIAEHCKPYIK